MKANEFVKNKGLKAAKLIIDCWIDYPETDVYLPDMMEYTFIAIEPTKNCPFVSLNDLKRLVESHELVEKYKRGRGIRFRVRWGMYRYGDTQEFNDRLKQAIADVESCMEVSSESN